MRHTDEERAQVARFIARHQVSVKDEVERDAAPFRDMPPEEKWRHLAAACRAAAGLIGARPDGIAIAARRDEPHASYREIIARLRGRR